jgi:hypothetical protein
VVYWLGIKLILFVALILSLVNKKGKKEPKNKK